MMEHGNAPSFNWSITNQVGSSIRTCELLHINVDRTPIPRFFSSYLLTVFSIDNGKKPKSIVIDVENRRNGFGWVVDEPIGSRLIFSVKDTNGGQGGYLPHIFEVVGSTTECMIHHHDRTPVDVHSAFSFRTTISEKSDDSNTLHVDVQGGMPPYETTLIWLMPSGFQVGPSIPFYQPPLIHSINIIKRDTLLTAVSDSNQKWAVGSSTLHFGSHNNSSHRIFQKHTSVTPYSSDLQTVKHQEDHTPLPPSTLQTILHRRSSDEGSFIIVVDVIALALLIIVTVAIIFCDVARRRKRRLAQAKDMITLQDVTVTDLEAAQATNTNNVLTEFASSSQKTSLDDPSLGAVVSSFPAVPPPTPVASSTNSRRSRASSFQIRSLVERTAALSRSPSLYGDPHPSSRIRRDTYRSDVQSDLSHKTSFGSNKTAKLIAKFHAPYFGGFYEASLTDSRSGMLSRNLSKSSTFTMRTDQLITPVPLSAVSTRPSWYQISADAPDVPALSCKDQDVEPHPQ